MKCHWCGKESKNVFCSPECVLQHDMRFPDWFERNKLNPDMDIYEVNSHLKWHKDTDGSVIAYYVKDTGTYVKPLPPFMIEEEE